MEDRYTAGVNLRGENNLVRNFFTFLFFLIEYIILSGWF